MVILYDIDTLYYNTSIYMLTFPFLAFVQLFVLLFVGFDI